MGHFEGGVNKKTGEKSENKTAEFFKNLLKYPGQFFTLSLNYTSKEKVNIKKHLSKSGIEGILYDLFITEQSGSCVSLQAKRIVLNDFNLTKYQYKALTKKIDELSLLPPSPLDQGMQPFMEY